MEILNEIPCPSEKIKDLERDFGDFDTNYGMALNVAVNSWLEVSHSIARAGLFQKIL